ncbi:hypothetical protein MKW92_014896 [Papaver armeniacum]|nr:hypothetical protein MKW92_014896 [Papaver armeniacum]
MPITHQPCSTSNTPTSLIFEAQRCMSLYFALCTKVAYLSIYIYVLIYGSSSPYSNISSHSRIFTEILAIISDSPSGRESLLSQDVAILSPVISSLPEDKVSLINLPFPCYQFFLSLSTFRQISFKLHLLACCRDHLIQVQYFPAEVLIAIHGIVPEKNGNHGIAMKKVMDACNACFEQPEVLAKVLNQLVVQIPLPLLFVLSVMQAIGAFPALVDFIMEILSQLVTKQIWKYPKLWVGFLKCAIQTQPQSFGVLPQVVIIINLLPAAQLESALSRTAVSLKAPLIAHAVQPSIRSSLLRYFVD